MSTRKHIARKLFDGAMRNAGQVCLAIKRVYVHDSQYEALGIEGLEQFTQRHVVFVPASG